MRALITTVFLLASLATAQAEAWVGAYVWGGVFTRSSGPQRLYDTVSHALAEGFQTIRVSVGPTAIDGVPISGCTGLNDTLACYARVIFASSVWDSPGLKRIMLTAIDRTCINAAPDNQACFTAGPLAANHIAIKAEYAALFAVLRERFGTRPIQFILSNWEGDNFVYCGSAYQFGTNAGGFASTCKASWPSGQTAVQRVQAHLQWHSYRDEAVAEAAAASPSLNVINAPEILAYNLFDTGCGGVCNPATDTILKQIAAAGGRAWCSYSSYDTQGPPGGSYLAAVQQVLMTCQNLVIGEAGFDREAQPLQKSVDVYRGMQELRSLPGVVGVIPWNYVDPADGSQKFGLFDSAGRAQLYKFLGPLRPTPQVPQGHHR